MGMGTFLHRIVKVTVLACFIVFCWSVVASAQVKVAVIPTTWNPQRYADALNPVLDKLGWKYDIYENVRLAELMPNLKQYNMVVFMTTYNFANTQDFGKYAAQWKDYLEAGGCLVVTDANYDHQTQWLGVVDKRLALDGIRGAAKGVTAKWMAKDHPLMKGIELPGTAWAQINSWASGWIPLAKDSTGIPYIAYQEIGNGVVVVSTCYSDMNWPNATFLENLLYWAQSPVRLRTLKTPEVQKNNHPKLGVPMLSKFPKIDGAADPDEWAGAVEVPGFVDYVTDKPSSLETKCRIAQGADDLYVLFECVKGNNDSTVKSNVGKFTDPEREDCVEIFIDPIRKNRNLLHFAVSMAGAKYAEGEDGRPWDRYWLAKVGDQKDRRIIEIRIPFTSLGLTQNETPATMWSINFARRYHPDYLNSQAFVWTPVLTSNEMKKTFGLLTGIKTDLGHYTVEPEMIVQSQKWLPGDNQVRLAISALSGTPVEAVLSFKAANSENDLQPAETISIGKDQTTFTTYPVKLDIDGRISGQFVLSDANSPGRILASSPTIDAVAGPLMEADLILPAYRNIVQSKDPKKELRVQGRIERAEFLDLRLGTQVNNQADDKIVWQETQNVQAGNSFEVKTSLASWPVGKYRVRLALTSGKASKKILSEKIYEISVLAPVAFEVTFDERRICYVNGKAFFPIGLYHTSPVMLGGINNNAKEKGLPTISMEEMLKDVKDHGFNIAFQTHAWGGSDEQYLKQAKDVGLYVVSEIGALDENTFKAMVGQANRIGNVLMWYNVDEPDLNKIRYVLPKVYELYQTIDPHRPTGAAIAGEAAVPYFPEAYDILMMDIYPFTDKPDLASSAGQMDRGLAVGKNRKPMWMVPQAYAFDPCNLQEPTCEQLRAQAYLEIVHGATGLMWYAYYESVYAKNPKGRGIWFLPDSPLWPFFKELNQEVAEISPIILNGESLGFAKWSSSKIHSAAWKYNGAIYLIAVNPTNEKIDGTLANHKISFGEVLFEKRKITGLDNVLKDTFNAYERHIYKIRELPD
jgi:hypothetical protein